MGAEIGRFQTPFPKLLRSLAVAWGLKHNPSDSEKVYSSSSEAASGQLKSSCWLLAWQKILVCWSG